MNVISGRDQKRTEEKNGRSPAEETGEVEGDRDRMHGYRRNAERCLPEGKGGGAGSRR